MVRRGLVSSRAEAGVAVDAKRVLVNGAIAEKTSRLVDPADAVVITGDAPRFVSRGGEKLDRALDQFLINVAGVEALDVGASTGGFTDCLLQRGAAFVVALDVGHGQLHPRVRNSDRVQVIERFNARAMTAADLDVVPTLAVADVSFISLTKIIPPIVSVVAPGGELVLLVKPQFEAGRQEVSKGQGIITDPAVHDRVRSEIETCLVDHECVVLGWCDSPITGGDGNREFLVHARTAAGI
jgi:23S rRNA (cytidine1920-2'-O)/16S rRNA (cytidine1409-2'-O)-methyltransferase